MRWESGSEGGWMKIHLALAPALLPIGAAVAGGGRGGIAVVVVGGDLLERDEVQAAAVLGVVCECMGSLGCVTCVKGLPQPCEFTIMAA